MMAKFARKARKGFTLVEIMIVVLIIGILLAIAVPNFIKARENSRQKSCIANLKQIESAKEQYAMDQKLGPTADVAMTDIAGGADKYIKVEPKCPTDDTAYTVGAMNVQPTCANSADGHALPAPAAP